MALAIALAVAVLIRFDICLSFGLSPKLAFGLTCALAVAVGTAFALALSSPFSWVSAMSLRMSNHYERTTFTSFAFSEFCEIL